MQTALVYLMTTTGMTNIHMFTDSGYALDYFKSKVNLKDLHTQVLQHVDVSYEDFELDFTDYYDYINEDNTSLGWHYLTGVPLHERSYEG